ncbi:MAG: Rossmann-like and DUF2520 domain-containing protein [Methyloligellaceae bacterium]
MKSIAIIGAGSVGKTLGHLFLARQIFRIGHVYARSEARAREAVDFIGAGAPVWRLSDAEPADLTVIATPDDAIAPTCGQLFANDTATQGGIVFHCSGATPSSVLERARERGSAIASLHPMKSFADPATSVETFPGTYCALEGDADAVEALTDAVTGIGGKPFTIATQEKLIYHAAAVFVCNTLPPLVEAGLDCCARAGVERDQAMEILRPLVEETVANIFAVGPAQALTGPVARGDAALVRRQLAAVEAWRPDYGEIYRVLAGATAELARAAGSARPDGLAEIDRLVHRNVNLNRP